MSRIGKRVLTIPENVNVNVDENKITVKGPKGELSLDLIKTIKVNVEGNTLTVTASGEITKVRYGYTCDMTKEIMEDVSKMVTVYDNNGFPLDLFIIEE